MSSWTRPRWLALVVACAVTAWVALARADDPPPLAEVLASATHVVRGNALDSYVKDRRTYTHFSVTRVIKGSVPVGKLLVRQPGAGEEGSDLWHPGDDAVILLDARDPADDSYPISEFPAGRYRVATAEDGEVTVLVNEMGVDGVYLSPKDKRPRSESVAMSLADFEAVARGTPVAAAPAPPPAPARSARPARAAAGAPSGAGSTPIDAVDPAAPPEAATRPWWIAFALAGVALVVALWVRRRSAR